MRIGRSWVVPALLLAGALCCLALGIRLETVAAAGRSGEPGHGQLTTPVLSARRIPGVVAAPVATQRLQADLAQWVGRSPAASCLVVAGAHDERYLDHRSDVPHVPASAQKLLTAAGALLELGPEHRYRTTVAATEPVVEGTLTGKLFLVGGGDPILATGEYAGRFVRQPQLFTDLGVLADAVVGAGIRRVEGAVVGDDHRYDQVRYVPGWPDRYIEQDAVGPLSALSVNDGFAGYPTEPDGVEELEPALDPAADAARVLTDLLRERGVEVEGEPRSGRVPGRAEEVAALESPPLIEITDQLLRESDNNTGELLLKEVGLSRSGQGSTGGGADAVVAALADELGDVSGTVVADGSGLSLDNRVSCHLLVELLQHPELGPSIVGGLAVAGESGTLQHRFGGELTGRLRGKTGTLSSVTALAGVLEDEDGPLSFAYLANVDPPTSIGGDTVGLQDELAHILLDWPRTPDVSVLGPQPPEPAGPVLTSSP